MGAPKLTERQQFDAIDLMGGDMSDRQIADKFGVEAQVIGRLRRKHGIASVDTVRFFQPTEMQIAELQEASDREMQRRYGVWKETWRKVRKRYGIARYRPPTTIKGEPNSWVEKKPKGRSVSEWGFASPQPIPPRDTSLAGEAAAFLQRERFTVYNRAKIGMGEGWQVGPSTYDDAGLIRKAERLGFEREEWMV